jgi:hypothetical protein
VVITASPDAGLSKRGWLVLGAAIAVLLVGALVWRLATNDDDATRVQASAATGASTAVSGAHAMHRVEALTAEISHVDRIEAKVVSQGELMAAGSPDVTVAGLEPDQLVWAVAVSGDMTAEFGHGVPLTWQVFVVDADTGDIKGTIGNNDVRWPPFFDALPGNAVVGR